jgi:hemolysin activation/secretion protein
LRVAYVRATGGLREPNDDGSTRFGLQVRAELRKGLDILNASRRRLGAAGGYQPTRAQGDPEAFVARGSVDAEVGLGSVLSLYAGARGQWSNHPLLNFEEYAIGNLTIGRGYDPGANSADRIIGLRGEPRVRLFERPGVVRADLFGFYDSVWLYNLDDNDIENGRGLGSYGGGVRLNRPGLAQLEVAYARPTNKALLLPGAKRAADRLLASLTFQFVPGAR